MPFAGYKGHTAHAAHETAVTVILLSFALGFAIDILYAGVRCRM
jgi:hypothetical protein